MLKSTRIIVNNESVNNSVTNNNTNSNLRDKISDKIYRHFKLKYPSTIDASGFNKNTINKIVIQAMLKDKIDAKSIGKIIDIIDHKFKTTINSDNRQGIQYDITNFAMDNESKIPIEKYLDNYTNKVSILNNDTLI